MKKGFFSFVAITLVALVLFVTASYLVIFNDFRYAAEKDLEIRRVAERMEDLQFAMNRTIADAAADSAYSIYGCDAPPVPQPDNYCSTFQAYLIGYFGNVSMVFMDTFIINTTILNLQCANATAVSSAYQFPALIGAGNNMAINTTKVINGTVAFNVSSAEAKFYREIPFNFTEDITRIPDAGTDIFAVRLTGASTVGSSINYTLGVRCA